MLPIVNILYWNITTPLTTGPGLNWFRLYHKDKEKMIQVQYINLGIYWSLMMTDIDQLTRILAMVGTPEGKILEKITSCEVNNNCLTFYGNMVFQLYTSNKSSVCMYECIHVLLLGFRVNISFGKLWDV